MSRASKIENPMLVILPIEPFEERYSTQWYEYFKRFAEENNIPHQIINPIPLSSKIEEGEFLDVSGTNWYKMCQLQLVIAGLRDRTIPSNSNILLLDGWFPGIEALFYIRDALNLELKIYSCLHAGTWDKNDFLTQKGMEKWAKRMEKSWLSQYKKSFVATDFHKGLINSSRTKKRDMDKIVVTGFPFYWEDDAIWKHSPIQWEQKENICVFPHRLAVEKNVADWVCFVEKMKEEFPQWRFLSTKLECRSKSEYYDLLKRSKIAVSTAYQETWGIAMQEALYSGCIPLVPDRLSYREMYPPEFKYKTTEDLEDRFRKILISFTIAPPDNNRWLQLVENCESRLRGKNHKALPKMFREIGYSIPD